MCAGGPVHLAHAAHQVESPRQDQFQQNSEERGAVVAQLAMVPRGGQHLHWKGRSSMVAPLCAYMPALISMMRVMLAFS